MIKDEMNKSINAKRNTYDKDFIEIFIRGKGVYGEYNESEITLSIDNTKKLLNEIIDLILGVK